MVVVKIKDNQIIKLLDVCVEVYGVVLGPSDEKGRFTGNSFELPVLFHSQDFDITRAFLLRLHKIIYTWEIRLTILNIGKH